MNHGNGKSPRDAVIVGAGRTPIGKFNGALSSLSGPQLGAAAVRAAVERAGIDPASIEEVMIGQVVAAGSGLAPGRQVALWSGLPASVGAISINKACGSSLKAVMLAASAIRAGDGDVYGAGGIESMSNAPYLLARNVNGARLGHIQAQDSLITDGLWCAFEDHLMGHGAQLTSG